MEPQSISAASKHENVGLAAVGLGPLVIQALLIAGALVIGTQKAKPAELPKDSTVSAQSQPARAPEPSKPEERKKEAPAKEAVLFDHQKRTGMAVAFMGRGRKGGAVPRHSGAQERLLSRTTHK